MQNWYKVFTSESTTTGLIKLRHVGEIWLSALLNPICLLGEWAVFMMCTPSPYGPPARQPLVFKYTGESNCLVTKRAHSETLSRRTQTSPAALLEWLAASPSSYVGNYNVTEVPKEVHCFTALKTFKNLYGSNWVMLTTDGEKR